MPKHAPVDADSHLYLIDASGYIFRAYHALPPLTRPSDGLPVGALAGFCNMLWRLLEELKGPERPTHFACVFDKGSHTFRNDLYPEYKANREEPPEDLRPQFPLVREAARAFGTPALEMAGFEADDLIATYARQAEARGARVTIVSSDKDLMQLVSERVSLLDTMKNKRLSFAEVEEKFGVRPERVVDVQALAGDSVDNVPGAPGIGIKTAAQLIAEYGDLDTLLSRAGEIKQPKRRETLVGFADQVRLSRDLVRLKDDVAVEVALEELGVTDPEPAALIAFLEGMEFRTITRRVREALEAEGQITSPAIKAGIDRSAYETVTDMAALRRWIAEATQLGVVAVDTETDSLDAVRARLVGISLATGPNRACYIPLAHVHPQGDDLLGGPAPKQIAPEDALAALAPLLADAAVLKVGQNLKYDMVVLARHGVTLAPHDDTMLMSFVLHAGMHGHGMDELSERYLSHTPISFKDVCGSGKSMISFDRVALDRATEYAAEDADVTLRLHAVLRPQLHRAHVATVYETLERPIAPVVADMERAGIRVDRDVLSRLSAEFAQRMAGLEAEAHELAGHGFNLGSPKQIGEILFGELGLPGGTKTPTGAWSTDADVLEGLANQHALPRAILDWRMLSKLRSTYTEALIQAINPDTGRVHTSYVLTGAQTGRFASTDPNLQNIPVRTEEGRKIRHAFIAEPGHVLISADYSQIELRLLAHLAGRDGLREAFRQGLDIHAMTASEIFGVPVEGMDPMVRRRAKAINFGIVYGISAFGLANQLGIGQAEARDIIRAYFEKFPGIRTYVEETKAFAREHGHVRTVFGRVIHLRDINSKNMASRGFAERQAINAPLQGAAADIIKRAMIRMPGRLAQTGLKTRMLLQVHDELVFEAPEAEAEAASALIRTVMETAHTPAVHLEVPITVDVGSGRTWGEAH